MANRELRPQRTDFQIEGPFHGRVSFLRATVAALARYGAPVAALSFIAGFALRRLGVL